MQFFETDALRVHVDDTGHPPLQASAHARIHTPLTVILYTYTSYVLLELWLTTNVTPANRKTFHYSLIVSANLICQ